MFVKSILSDNVNEMKENNMLRHIIRYKNTTLKKNFVIHLP